MGDYQEKSAVILQPNNTTESLFEHIQKTKSIVLGDNCPFESLPFLFKVCGWTKIDEFCFVLILLGFVGEKRTFYSSTP